MTNDSPVHSKLISHRSSAFGRQRSSVHRNGIGVGGMARLIQRSSMTWDKRMQSIFLSTKNSLLSHRHITAALICGSVMWTLLSILWLMFSTIFTSNTDPFHNDTIINSIINNDLGSFKGPKYQNKQQTLDRRPLFETAWMSISQHSVRTENGKLIQDWLWADIHDQINVLVTATVDSEERFLVFNQTKYGYNGYSLAVVGGHIDPGERPLHAAQRELKEELKRRTHSDKQWTYFGGFRTDVNRGLGFCHTFLARQTIRIESDGRLENDVLSLQMEGEEFTDETERLHLITLSFSEVLDLYLKGYFIEAKWANTVGLSLLYLLNSGEELR